MSENYSNIPSGMREIPHWVVWRKEMRNDKETKIPYHPDKTKASVTDPGTWVTFDEAVAGVGWLFNGIGFVLTADDPYVVIDYDEECPQDVIDSFDTYIERSQSGRGVHIIMEGSFTGKKRKGKVECYQDNRYMIMTGDVVKPDNIQNCQKQLDKWRSKHELDATESATTVIRDIVPTDALGSLEDIKERMFMSSNGERLRDYFENGHPIGSDCSQIDAVLLEGLRFWSGGNREIACALFEQSACVRDKWINREDYRNSTWKHVDSGEVWTPPEIDVSYVEDRMIVGEDFCSKVRDVEQALWEDSGMPMLSEDQYNPTNMGALSDICKLFVETSPKPIPSFAMHTALACIGNYLGRRFKTVSGNYTSMYWAIIGPTGCGKGHGMKVIDHVMKSLDDSLLTLVQGSGYTSESGIFSTLQDAPAHLGPIDELGDYISGTRGNSNSIAQAQWRVLKEAWCNNGVLRPKNFSDHSVKTKSRATMHCICPNISLYGGSTVAQFWSSLSIKDGADGFLNRWLIYTDDRPVKARRKVVDLHDIEIPKSLHRWHKAITKRSPITMTITSDGDDESSTPMVSGNPQESPDPVVLDWADGAEDLFYHYQVDVVDSFIDDSFKYDMLQRAAQMARNISLIIELSMNPGATEVSKENCLWAIEYVNTVIAQMAKHAKRNIAGNDEEALALKLLDAIRKSGKRGMIKKEMQALKIEQFTSRNFKDAMERLLEGELVDKKYRETGNKGRKPVAYYAIEVKH